MDFVASLLLGLVGIFFPLKIFMGLDVSPTSSIGSQLSCNTKVGAVLFPKALSTDKKKETVEVELVRGGSKITLEINDKEVKFLTNTSLETGSMEPAIFNKIEDSKDSLIAVNYQEGTITSSISTLTLNKRTGLAVWNKSHPKSLFGDNPDGQTYYLQCR